MQLTPEEMAEFRQAAVVTWEYLAADVGGSITRSEMIELVLDADRLITLNPTLPMRIKEYVNTTPYATLQHDLFPAFHYRRYGY